MTCIESHTSDECTRLRSARETQPEKSSYFPGTGLTCLLVAERRISAATRQGSGLWSFLAVLAALSVATSLVFRLAHPGLVAFKDGQIALGHGNQKQAKEFFEQALKLGVNQPLIDLQLARICLAQGDTAAARTLLENFLSKDPSSMPGRSVLAGVLQHDGEISRATHLYLDALDNGQTLPPDARLHLADLFRQQKLYPDSDAIYRDLSGRGDRIGATASLHLAQSLAWQRNYDEAIRMLRAIIASAPDNAQARLLLARVLSWSGRNGEAVAEYKKILKEP